MAPDCAAVLDEFPAAGPPLVCTGEAEDAAPPLDGDVGDAMVGVSGADGSRCWVVATCVTVVGVA